jgi:hypothetical protein
MPDIYRLYIVAGRPSGTTCRPLPPVAAAAAVPAAQLSLRKSVSATSTLSQSA